MVRDVKLGPKVLIFIGTFLVLVLGVSFHFMLKQSEESALFRTSHLIEDVGFAVAKSMERAMVKVDLDFIQELVEEVAKRDFESITILDWNKVVRQSSKRDGIGKGMSDLLTEEVFSTKTPKSSREVEGDTMLLRQVRRALTW